MNQEILLLSCFSINDSLQVWQYESLNTNFRHWTFDTDTDFLIAQRFLYALIRISILHFDHSQKIFIGFIHMSSMVLHS